MVYSRPRTAPEDAKSLFYSYDDTQRFRYEYRLERKYQAHLNLDSSAVSVKSVKEQNLQPCVDKLSTKKHSISRVVVLHNNTLKTFYDNNSSAKLTNAPLEKSLQKNDEAFFDNDSFWSGSITWF